ncbi:hypothetical protein [Herpetosiphon llansteffanensis]|uniref:hypothetical protein n=1 Tax=Herpetosiphon llansteffanensis TaxID=2094568 RepID=UPI000F51ABAD|nr:hypothetical protein [Herpetosiphon llansteffanensis]
MRRWCMLISLLLLGCMQQPAQPRPTALPQAAVLPTQAVPATLRAPTTEPTLQPSIVPTASFASATPTIEAPPTSTPISAPPFTAPVDLIVAGLDISHTTIIISQLYGDSETSPMYEIPCFAEAGCDEVSIFSIPHHQELALKINARGDSRLYLVNLETQTHSQIADQLISFRSNVVAAPDGNTLAFIKMYPEMRKAAPMNETSIWGYDLTTKELFAITDWGYYSSEIYWLDSNNLVFCIGRVAGTSAFETWQVAIDDLEPPAYQIKGKFIAGQIDPPRWFLINEQEGLSQLNHYFPATAELIHYSEPFTTTDGLDHAKTITMQASPDLRQALLIENDTLLQQSTLTIITSSSAITLPIPYQYSYQAIFWSSDSRYAFVMAHDTIIPVDPEQAVLFAPIRQPTKLNIWDGLDSFLAIQGR